MKKQLTSFPDMTISMQHPMHWFFSGRIVLHIPMCTAWPLILQLFIMLYNAELCKYCLLGQMYFVVLHLEIFLWSLPFLGFITRHKTMQLLKKLGLLLVFFLMDYIFFYFYINRIFLLSFSGLFINNVWKYFLFVLYFNKIFAFVFPSALTLPSSFSVGAFNTYVCESGELM